MKKFNRQESYVLFHIVTLAPWAELGRLQGWFWPPGLRFDTPALKDMLNTKHQQLITNYLFPKKVSTLCKMEIKTEVKSF